MNLGFLETPHITLKLLCVSKVHTACGGSDTSHQLGEVPVWGLPRTELTGLEDGPC